MRKVSKMMRKKKNLFRMKKKSSARNVKLLSNKFKLVAQENEGCSARFYWPGKG
jgi:hypothetical protein